MPKVVKWKAKLASLQGYKERNGDTVLVPQRYFDESSGFKLGHWVSNLRSGCSKLSNTQRNDLDRMGFVWNASKALPWETKLAALLDYKERNGDVLVPKSYVDESTGIKLGNWVNHLRSGNSNLSDSQRTELDRFGFVWIPKKGPRPKPLVRDIAFADAATATMTTKVARKKKGTASYSELNQRQDNAASFACAPAMATSRSNNSCSSSTVIDHHNKTEDTDDDGKRAPTRGSRSNKELCANRADRGACAENQVSSLLLELDAKILKLQVEIKSWEAKNLLQRTQDAAHAA
jgi:hypothetical protein